MRLHIIRHADPDYTRDHLTALGKSQAQALSSYMESLPLVRIVSSPKGRAQATARPTAEKTGFPVETLEWLRELELLRTPYESDVLPDPVVIWDLPGHVLRKVEKECADCADSGAFPQPITAECFERVRGGLKELLGEFGITVTEEGWLADDRLPGYDVAIFCHHGVGLALLSAITGIPAASLWRSFWLAPASVSTVLLEQYEGNRVNPRLICVSDTRHLTGGLCSNTSGIIYNVR